MATVSVVLTSYNHAKFLRAAIDSIINQTYTDWELFIWDDVSSDNSWEVIQSYDDPRIIAIRNERTRRYIYAINKTISELAKGKYIAIHHSDDLWERDKLAQQVEYLNANPEKAAVFTDARIIDENDKELGKDWFYTLERSRAQWLRVLFLNENRLCHPSVMVRRNIYIDLGLYKLAHAQIDDAEMWTRLLMKHEIHVIPTKLTRLRVFSTGANVSSINPTTSARLQFEWFEQKKHFLSLAMSEILDIFPEARKWLNEDDEGDCGFVLAMAAINLGNCRGTRLFGLDLLYNLMTDPARSEIIYRLHQFNYLDFIKLTGQCAVFVTEETVPARVSSLRSLYQKLKDVTHKMLNS